MSGDRFFFTEQEKVQARQLERTINRKYGVTISWIELIGVGTRYVMPLLYGRDARLFHAAQPNMFIARPRKVRVDRGRATITYPNGVKATYEISGETEEARIDVVMRLMRSYHVVMFNGRRWTVQQLISLDIDTDAANELLEQYHERDVLAWVLNLRDGSVLEKYWWRVAPLFDMHIIEISAPGSGKTTYSLMLQRYHGFVYYSEPPTLARLVYDASTMEYGELYSANGVIFDEFDKYASKQRSTFKELYGVLLTGMEQGHWTRGARMRREDARIDKHIPVVIFGNVIVEQLIKGAPRDAVANMLGALLKVDAKPLVDRADIVVLDEAGRLRFMGEYEAERMLRPNVARGVVEVLRERYDALYAEVKPPSSMDARTREHYRRVAALAQLLDLQIDIEAVVRDGVWG